MKNKELEKQIRNILDPHHELYWDNEKELKEDVNQLLNLFTKERKEMIEGIEEVRSLLECYHCGNHIKLKAKIAKLKESLKEKE